MTEKTDVEKIAEKLEEENKKDNNSRPKVKVTQKIGGLLSKLNQKILDSNGFLTKEGGYLCKAEWHAVAIPAGWVSAAYMLPKPLNVLTFVSFLLMNKKGFDLLNNETYDGHWNDVMEEYAYAAVSFGLTVAYWTYVVEERIAGAEELNSILGRLLLGA